MRQVEQVLHLAIAGIEADGLLQVGNGFRIAVQQVVSVAPRGPRQRIGGIETDGGGAVGDALVVLSQKMVRTAARHVSLGANRGQFHGLIAIVERFLILRTRA